MGLPHRRCANCRHFVHDSPLEVKHWTRWYGHCYQRSNENRGTPPFPAHANSRGCVGYEENMKLRGLEFLSIARIRPFSRVVFGQTTTRLLRSVEVMK